jgi:transcriptional regulator with XRE-family HTH domain
MILGDRIRELREDKKLSQGDIEKRTGLIRSYLSRVENGHTVPSLETLEKLAAALEVPLYVLLYDGNEPPPIPKLPVFRNGSLVWGAAGKDAIYVEKLRRALAKMSEDNRRVIALVAQKLSRRHPKAAPSRD